MTRKVFPGAWYADAVQGAYAVLYPDSSIETPQGLIGLPPGGNVLFLVCAIYDGNVVLAGQGHQDGQAWLWNGHEWRAMGLTYGTSPCAFGPQGLYVSMPGTAGNIAVINPLDFSKGFPLTQSIGARGIALVSPDGQVHAQDVWYGLHGLAEFVDLDRVYVGQGANGGCVIQDRLLEPGNVQFVRAHRVGDALAVAMWKPDEKLAVCHWLQVSDIAQLPLVNAPIDPPPPPPPPPPPRHMGITDAQFATLERVRAKYGETLDEAQIGALLNEVAWIHRAEGVGMQRKDGGTNATQPRTGIKVWRGMRFAGNIGQDVLGSASIGKCIPVRGADGPADPNTFVAPVEPEGVVIVDPPPPPPPPPGSELETRVSLLEQSVRRIVSQMHSV